jgi:hypothetical protein
VFRGPRLAELARAGVLNRRWPAPPAGRPAYTTAVVEAGGKRNVNWAAARGKWNVASGLKDNLQVSTLST